MKKILGLLILGSVLSFVGCDKDDPKPAAPTITIDPATTQNVPGATVTVSAAIDAPGGAQSLALTGSVSETITLNGEKTLTQDISVPIPANAAIGSSLIVVMILTDKSNQVSAPATLTITVGDPTIVLTGTASANVTIEKGKSYLVKSQYIIPTGITLTVAAGAVVKGDKASKGVIVIQPGGKIMAVGTAAEPIVFTSSQNVGERDRGDWGGIVWLGNAYVNQISKPNVEGLQSPSQPYGTPDHPAPVSISHISEH